MSEAAKPDPSAEQAAAPGATQVKDETAKVTSGVTEAPKVSEEKTATEKVAEATTTVKDNVFSMFGGGPKKEKKEEVDDANEPSGATKKEADVSWIQGTI